MRDRESGPREGTMYIQANIGRNVETEVTAEGRGVVGTTVGPMSDDAWTAFQQDVKEEILLAIHDSEADGSAVRLDDFQVHTGMGEWDGVQEESAHVSVYFDSPAGMTYKTLNDGLESRLSYMAFQYGQDAIAFIVTDSHLATR